MADGRTPDLSRIESTAFAAPPADAPRQSADNSAAALGPTAEQIARARANEQELAPLTFRDSVNPPKLPAAQVAPAAPVILGPDGHPYIGAVVPGSPAEAVVTSSFTPPAKPLTGRQAKWAAAVAAGQAGRPASAMSQESDHGTVELPRTADRPADSGAGALGDTTDTAAEADTGSPVSPDGTVPARPPVLTESDLRSAGARPAQPYQPAASDTDSPSRGQPRAVADEGKRITGGFGPSHEAQYFPLDGSEVRAVADGLLDQIRRRILDDLRFSLAVTYPRVRVRVELIVEAYAQDQQVIPAVGVPHNKTPIEIAREYGDEIVFVLVEQRAEFAADGTPLDATNAMRAEVGLEIPFKRQIQSGAIKLLVDREN